MRISISKTYIISILICLSNFFGLYNFLPFANQLYFVDLIYLYILVFSLLYFAICCVKRIKSRKFTRYEKSVFYLAVFLIIITILELVFSFFSYSQGFFNVLKESSYYFIFAFLILLVLLQIKTKSNYVNVEWFLNKVIQFSIYCSLMAIVLFVLYTFWGLNPLNLDVTRIRNETIRFGIGDYLVIISIIISIVRLINGDSTKKDVVNIILGCIQIYYINKTRSVILYLIILTSIMILRMKKSNKLIKSLLITTIIISSFFIFVGNVSILESANQYIESDYGLLARLSAIEFYFKQFLNKPILGMGFISTKKTIEGWQLLYGSKGIYYRGDVGIIGLINAFGIIGLLWAVLFLKRIYMCTKSRFSNAMAVKYIILYFVISSISLSFMDAERLIYMIIPLILAFLLRKNEIKETGHEKE